MSDLFKRIAGSPTEKRSSTLAAPDQYVRSAFTGSDEFATHSVTPESATKLTSVWSAVRAFTDAAVTIPMEVQRETEIGRELAKDTPTWQLLAEEANPEHTSAELYEIMMFHLQLYGNAFLRKVRDSNGNVTQLWPWMPGNFQVGRANGEKFYLYTRTDNGQQIVGHDRDFVHVRGVSYDGLLGLSPIERLSERLAAIESISEYQSKFYRNSAMPSGILKTPSTLGEEAAKRLASEWRAMHSGSANTGKVVLLEAGMDYQPLTINPVEQQFIQQAQFSVQEVARAWRLPAWVLNESSGDSLTYSTTESASRAFVQNSLMPWLRKIELALRRDGDIIVDRTLYPKFNVDELLRADMKTRIEANATAVSAKIKTVNEARRDEGLPDREGGDEITAKSEVPMSGLTVTLPESTPVPQGNE